MKTFVVTGAGTGIGRAAALSLASSGEARLCLVGRRAALLDETLDLLGRGSHRAFAFDSRDRQGWREMMNALGPDATIEGVFANAGIGGGNTYGEDDRWDEVLSANLTGTYVTIMECLPKMRLSREPFRHILITSSCLARFGVAGYTAYCTAKTGLLGLTRSLAVEMAPEKILVNAICPGWVDTDMARAGIRRLAGLSGTPFEAEWQRQQELVPAGRFASPEEVGELVAFLMSGKQNSITGQGIDINNGSFMQ